MAKWVQRRAQCVQSLDSGQGILLEALALEQDVAMPPSLSGVGEATMRALMQGVRLLAGAWRASAEGF